MKYLQHQFSQRKLDQKVIQVQAISLVKEWKGSLHNNQSCTHHVIDQNQQLLQLSFHPAYIISKLLLCTVCIINVYMHLGITRNLASVLLCVDLGRFRNRSETEVCKS